jgi:hypothetical protein
LIAVKTGELVMVYTAPAGPGPSTARPRLLPVGRRETGHGRDRGQRVDVFTDTSLLSYGLLR